MLCGKCTTLLFESCPGERWEQGADVFYLLFAILTCFACIVGFTSNLRAQGCVAGRKHSAPLQYFSYPSVASLGDMIEGAS